MTGHAEMPEFEFNPEEISAIVGYLETTALAMNWRLLQNRLREGNAANARLVAFNAKVRI